MTSASAQKSYSPSSSESTQETINGTKITIDLADLPSIWSLLTPELQKQLWNGWPISRGAVSSLEWMRHWTKTKDEQDPLNPFKHFPNYEYFDVLHYDAEREPVLFLEKSRTMMASWWAVAEDMHYVMTHPPATAIFWAQDQDRSVVLREYAWTLWEQQHPLLKEAFPVLRPKDRQSFDMLEFRNGAKCIALPGKDPDKIRSLHPARLLMDEACFIENGAEAFDVAISSKVPKVKVVSSAAPSWFRRLTKPALPEPLPEIIPKAW